MKNLQLLLLFSFLGFSSLKAQDYKLDNKAYSTISWNDFFYRLEKNPNLVYYDIRTPGERNDTSQYGSSNQGHIRGALQMDYYEFDKYYPELLKHKKDTVYFYCSHSMRSRRLAQQLSDSAFKHVVSINGGISYLNMMGNTGFPLRKKYYENSLQYKLVSPLDFDAKLKNNQVQVIDVRTDSIYFGTTLDEQDKSYGQLKGVLHIDPAKLNENISKLSKQKEIMLVDNYGDETPAIANKLISLGFKNVSVLLFGLDQLRNNIPASARRYLSMKYSYILPTELAMLKKSNDIVIIDIRTENEFNNKDTIPWKNVGYLKDAINIPYAQLTAEKIQPFLNKKVVIYDLAMMPPDLYKSAELMRNYGVKDLMILSGGIFKVRWDMANTGKSYLKELLTNQ